MPYDKLHDTLQSLNQELAVAESLDDKTASKLRDAIAQIETALQARNTPTDSATKNTEEKTEGTPESNSEPEHSFLTDAARDFEASHPVLSRTLIRLVDLLGQAGI